MFCVKKPAAVLPAAALMLAPMAADADWIVRLGGVWRDSGNNNLSVHAALPQLGPTEERIAPGDEPAKWFGDVTWLFENHLGLEFWINAPFISLVSSDAANGRARVGKIEYFSPLLDLQWHFLPDSWVRPYVGGGGAYTRFDNIEPPALTVKNRLGLTGGAGIDFGPRGGGWIVNVFAQYVDAATDASAPTVSTYGTTLQVRPWVFGFGFGYQFAVKNAR
jgi:outer membrane protein W